MKKYCLLYFLMIFGVILSNFSPCQTITGESKNLIVYLSRTKNTKVLAEIIHKKVGGKLVELELQNPYPENYKETVKQVSEELEQGFLPSLKTKINDIQQYDIVFIGFPTWSMQLPPPMQSFLMEHKFKNKQIIPFNTNAGYGLGNTIEKIKEICPQAEVMEAFSMIGGKETNGIFLTIEGEKAEETEKQVASWLKRLRFL